MAHHLRYNRPNGAWAPTESGGPKKSGADILFVSVNNSGGGLPPHDDKRRLNEPAFVVPVP